jgi:putative transposase
VIIITSGYAYVLAFFGKTVTNARKSYTDYVSKCAAAGRRPELTGGGLTRSAGGWRAIRAAYEAGIRLTCVERILGSSSFVEKTLASAGEDYDRRMRLKACGIDLEVVMDVVSAHLGVYTAELTGPSHRQQISQACTRVMNICQICIYKFIPFLFL